MEERNSKSQKRTRRAILSGLATTVGVTALGALPTMAAPEDNATRIGPNESVTGILNNAQSGETYHLESGTHHATDLLMLTADGLTLVIPGDATLKAPDGVSEGDSFINVRANNVAIHGGGTIDGNQSASDGLGANPPDSHGHEHIVHAGHHSIDRVSGFSIERIRLTDAPGGDGVYLSQVADSTVRNVTIERAYRNGISGIDVRNSDIENFHIIDTGGTAPGAGIGFEPNSEGQVLDGVRVTNGIIEGGESHGLYLNNHFTNQTEGSSTINISISHLTVENNGLHGFSMHGTSGAERVRITDSISRSNARAGYYIAGDGDVVVAGSIAVSNGQNRENNNLEVGVVSDRDHGNDAPGTAVVKDFGARDEDGSQKHPGTALDGSTLRVRGATLGAHTHDRDGFRAHGSGSRVEYGGVDVESGGEPAFATNGGSVEETNF